MKRSHVLTFQICTAFGWLCFMTPCYKLVLIYPLNYIRRTEPFSFLFEHWANIFEKNENKYNIYYTLICFIKVNTIYLYQLIIKNNRDMKRETLDLVTLSPSEKSIKLCDFLTSLIEKDEDITDFVVSTEVLTLIEMSSCYKGFTSSQVGATGKFKGIKIIHDNYQEPNTLKICYKTNLINVI